MQISFYFIWFMPFIFIYSFFSAIERNKNNKNNKVEKLIASISLFLMVSTFYCFLFYYAN